MSKSIDLEGKHVTAEEWRAIVDSDPVLQFVERVNQAAKDSPLWAENYSLALYRVYSTEVGRYVHEHHGIASIGFPIVREKL